MEKLYLTLLERDNDIIISLSVLSNCIRDKDNSIICDITKELIELIQISHISAFETLNSIRYFRIIMSEICDKDDNLINKSKTNLITLVNKHFVNNIDVLKFKDITFSRRFSNKYGMYKSTPCEDVTVQAIDLFFK